MLTRRTLLALSTAPVLSEAVEDDPKGAFFDKLSTRIPGWSAISGDGAPLIVCLPRTRLGIELWSIGHTVIRTTPWALEQALGLAAKLSDLPATILTTRQDIFDETDPSAQVVSVILLEAYKNRRDKGAPPRSFFAHGVKNEPTFCVWSKKALDELRPPLSKRQPSLIPVDL